MTKAATITSISDIRMLGTTKQDVGVSDIGNGPGVLIDVPGMGPGNATSYRNNVPVLDFRQTTDIVPFNGSATRPMRPPAVLLRQKLGDYTTTPLTGTVTVNASSPNFTGTNTHFLTELSTTTYAGPTIKLDSDGSTCWALVSSIPDDTHGTFAANYPGAPCSGATGGTGSASMLVGEEGMGIVADVAGGTPNSQASGEYVGLLTVIERESTSLRGIYGGDFNVNYSSPASASSGQAYGLELSVGNYSGSDDSTSNYSYGLSVLSSGNKKPGTGIFVGAVDSVNGPWKRGMFLSSCSTCLLEEPQADALQIIPPADDSSIQLHGRNHANATDVWSITNSGGFNTSGTFVASGTTGPTLANGNAEILASTGSGGLFGGQGSTYDTTIVNKNNAAVCSVPTGTTTLDCFGPLQVGSSLLLSNAAPTISSGFGTSPSVAASNGTAAFQINVGRAERHPAALLGSPPRRMGGLSNART